VVAVLLAQESSSWCGRSNPSKQLQLLSTAWLGGWEHWWPPRGGALHTFVRVKLSLCHLLA